MLQKLQKSSKNWAIIFPFHYGLFSNCVDGPYKSKQDLLEVLYEIRKYWPSDQEGFYFGLRCWAIEGLKHSNGRYSLTPWAYAGDAKWNLEKFSMAYWIRLEEFLSTLNEQHILCILDLWDHWSMYSRWIDHPLHPNNNLQKTYGHPGGSSAFPAWYDLAHNTELAMFQARYIWKISEIAAKYPYVIISTGNEMRDGDNQMRKVWHYATIYACKMKAPGNAYSENDPLDCAHDDSYGITLPTSLIEVHSMGGIKCQGQGYSGTPNWEHYKKYGKLVLFDNDGLPDCRNTESAMDWFKMAMNTSRIYGCKTPFPNKYYAEENGNWLIWRDQFFKKLITALKQMGLYS